MQWTVQPSSDSIQTITTLDNVGEFSRTDEIIVEVLSITPVTVSTLTLTSNFSVEMATVNCRPQSGGGNTLEFNSGGT